MDKQVHDITSPLESENTSVPSKIKKIATVVIVTAGAVALITHQVQKFADRKNVQVVVEDNADA